jgi:undecaprenyl diphosphate synthase
MALFKKNLQKVKDAELKDLINYNKLPDHIAIIMDGNGRWAKKKNLPRSAGHKVGADVLDKITTFCRDLGIKYMTIYAFSTENWKRPKEEVDALMDILLKYLTRFENEYKSEDNIILRLIGDMTPLSDEVKQKVKSIDKMLENETGMILNLAINYGGRDEIINCVKSLVKDNVNPEDINEEMIQKYLYTKDIPDPDLIIRTSGEKRLSNFLIWQGAYSEFYVTDVLWPDFKGNDILKSIYDYQNRERRFGGV